jgi:hypothetical protein
MSEQAVLIPSVPPVAPTTATAVGPETNLIADAAGAEIEAVSITISSFQNIVHLSSVAAACMFGFAAILAFQQSGKRSKAVTALYRTFGVFLILLTIHAFISNRLFAAYLNQHTADASLAYRMAGWVLLAPLLAWMRALFLGYNKAKHGLRPIVSVMLSGVAFLLLAISLPQSVRANAALLFMLLSICLYVVIIARAASFKKQVQSRKTHPLLLHGMSLNITWIGCTLLPALLPVIGFAKLVGMDHDFAHFAVTVTEFFTVIVIFLGLLSAEDELSSGEESAQPESSESYEPNAADDFSAASFGTENIGIPDPFSQAAEPKSHPTAPTQPSQPKPQVAPQKEAPKITPPPDKPKVSPPPADTPSIKAPPKPKRRFDG